MSNNHSESPAHFKGKDAVGHVVEAQAQGMMAAAEIHGTEVPGHLAAGADAARETTILLLMLSLFFSQISFPYPFAFLILFSIAYAVWKLGRSAWLGWSRLERLHRVLAQERWEIMHHRQQERSELKELYAAKGFEGKLLEDVLDVLMADDNRLLKVMVEEELGLSLASHEHPLKQGLGALLGSLGTALILIAAYYLFSAFGLVVAALAVTAFSAYLLAHHVQNRIIPAMVWNVGLIAFTCALFFFLMQYVILKI